MEVLDLFSAAAGGWSLGMHRAGFRTIAACEAVDWRRALYASNNPEVPIYDDVRTLTADRLLRDLGRLPSIVVGSPPCQDISSANARGKGVEGERSRLFFEAIRLIGEIRPRWFALENSANLRTRGADPVLAALEALDYACWPLVVRASDIGANHERPRSWLIGCDLGQVADADRQLPDDGAEQSRPQGQGCGLPRDGAADRDCGRQDGAGALSGRHGGMGARQAADAGHSISAGRDALGRRSGRPERLEGIRADGRDAGQEPAPHPDRHGQHAQPEHGEMAKLSGLGVDRQPGETAHADQAGQADGRMEPGLRQAQIAHDGCGDGRGLDRPGVGQMGLCPPDRGGADPAWPRWSLDDLAARLRLDVGLPARPAGTRVAVGGPGGTSAASLVVEAYGDAAVPQIPEAIGRAILRTEQALRAVMRQAA